MTTKHDIETLRSHRNGETVNWEAVNDAIDNILATLERLPLTANGVVAENGMMLHSSNPQYAGVRFVVTSWSEWDPGNGAMATGWRVYPANETGRPVRLAYSEDIDCLYSTPEAARTAKGGA